MMRLGIYISHPEVEINPDIPVPQWGLSAQGTVRAQAFAQRKCVPSDLLTYSSCETKAKDLAAILQENPKARFARTDMDENDRSSTGFLNPEEFEKHVIEFFGHPEQSYRGWESATGAQARIVNAVKNVIQGTHDDALLFCGHGGVGTLLKCALGDRPISQNEDQRVTAHSGGGNCFAFDLDRFALLCDWTPMEDFKGYL